MWGRGLGWYIVIKTIKGQPYQYRQRTWREGGRVRTESVYLGRADGGSRKRGSRTAVNTTEAGGPGDGVEREGEEAFIAGLMSEEGAYKPAYDWDAPAREEPLVLSDPDVLRIASRMGVAMMTQTWPSEYDDPNCPVYDSGADSISIPDIQRHRSVAECSAERLYCVDVLHETVHATVRRLRRPLYYHALTKQRQAQLYYREELVAELGANLVARRLGLSPENSGMSAAYLRSYRYMLVNEEKAVAWAIKQAKRAADYLLRFHPRGGWRES